MKITTRSIVISTIIVDGSEAQVRHRCLRFMHEREVSVEANGYVNS